MLRTLPTGQRSPSKEHSVHQRTGVSADAEVLVPLKNDRYRALPFLGRYLLPVDLEHARAGPAEAAHVVGGQRGEVQAVVREVAYERVLTRLEGFRALPSDPLAIEQARYHSTFLS